MTANTPATAEQILEHAAQLLGVSTKDVWAEEITQKFPWLKNHQILWIMSRDRRSVVFALRDKSPLIVTNRGTNRLEALSSLIRDEAGGIHQLSATERAEAVRRLTEDPRGQLGSAALLQRKSPPHSAWNKSGSRDGERILRQYCVDPTLAADPANKNKWTLRFFWFNPSGGVEEWNVAGTRDAIDSAGATAVVPDGTLNWPFE